MTLKIAIAHSDLPELGKKPGGVCVAIHELANALVKLGNEVRIYAHSLKPNDALYEVINLPQIGKSRRINRRLVFPFQLGSIDWQGLDVLHLHGDDWAFWQRSLPTVRTFNGCACQESKFADNLKSKLVHAAYHPLELWAGKLANFTVGVGDDSAKLLGAQQIIPYGYEQTLFYPDTKAPEPTAIVIGTLKGRKRSQLAIELLLSLLPQIPNLKIHAAIDKPYHHPAVQSWIGISREQLAALVRESWLGVSTTLYEGLGMYYLEWMAAGTVPVTLENIGAKSLIADAQAGAIANNLPTLKKTVLSLLKDAETRENYARNGIAAMQQLTWENIAQQYMQIYHQAINNYAQSLEGRKALHPYSKLGI